MKNVLPKNLLNIIKEGENVTVEFKTAKNKLPSNLFETICAISLIYAIIRKKYILPYIWT